MAKSLSTSGRGVLFSIKLLPARMADPVLGLRNRHFFVLDLLALLCLPAVALALRVDDLHLWAPFGQALAFFTLLALLVKMAIFYRLGIYRRYWRYAGVNELALLAMAVSLSTCLLAAGFFVAQPLLQRYGLGFPRTVPLIDGMLTGVAVSGYRLALRGLNQWRQRERGWPAGPLRPVLIAGAGEAGGIIARELRGNPQLGLYAIGFVDDDPAKQRVTVHGLPVLGTTHDLPWLVLKHDVSQVVIAMPRAPGNVIRHIREMCEKTGAAVRTMPGIYEILSGTVSLRQVREVQIEDLLRREPVVGDLRAIHGYLYRRRVAVTGAGGSIGSELCRQIAAHQPGLLLLIGHGENSIFAIEQELRRTFPAVPVQPVIADIRDRARMDWIFETCRPHIVFHAAAHKHVPLMEYNIIEAVTNNIVGTRNVVQAAAGSGVERLVMISTDKAVCPANVMGASKRVAELIVQAAAARLGRPYAAVRFGNVLGSRGSVVPIFKEQVRAGGPVTVTHPEMTRYFMTIPEAVHLVLEAGVLGTGGEVFVLDMGRPVKVLELAEDLIRLSGLRPYEDIDIIFTGMRPGEKLHESLFCQDEEQSSTGHDKILAARNGHVAGLDDLDEVVDRLERLAQGQHEAEILDVLGQVLGVSLGVGSISLPAAAPSRRGGGEFALAQEAVHNHLYPNDPI